MPSLPHADNQRRSPERPGARLSPALSFIVIAGLSAVSWAVLMFVVLALVSLV